MPNRPTPPRPRSTHRRWTRCAAAAALAAASALAQAVPIVVLNPGFEADAITAGAFVVLTPQGWQAHDPDGLLAADPGQNAIGVIRPLPGLEYFPGGTPEGVNAGLVFLAGAGSGEAGLRQTLAATLQAQSRYTLQVAIGNIASGTSLPGSSGGAGNFFNLDGFPGYRIDLLAGSTLLASDLNGLGGGIPEGEFRTATLVYDSDAAPAQLGQALQIRLVNLKQPGSLAMPNIEVDFDQVRLDVSPVPEPATVMLWLVGLAGLAAGARTGRLRPGPTTRQ